MKIKLILVCVFLLALSSCSLGKVTKVDDNKKFVEKVNDSKYEIATFAGGCFWCVEHPFDENEGVIEAVSGYIGGFKENPTYKEVTKGDTGHYEAVQITYDPALVSYEELLDIFWRQINPTDDGGQFVDRGDQYRSAIFYHNIEQKTLAQSSKNQLDKSGLYDSKIITPILEAQKFYVAEDYHQNYAHDNPIRYDYHRSRSGRDGYLESIWRDEANLKERLTQIQYYVTQEDGTEKPFDNEYWNNTKEGIYVDIVSGEALYSSKDKFKSGTGWPSFSKGLNEENLVKKSDRKLIIKRTELRSREGDSHLGHLFEDGPAPTGLRHCINSAALRFIPKEDLEKEGYSEYKDSFN